MMKKLMKLGLVLLCSAGFGNAQAETEQFCTSSYLASCQALDSDACLSKFHACGQYDAIIQHLAAEGSTDANSRYFKGVSYHGLLIRNRAKSLQCQFAKSARAELAAYLYLKRKSGLADPVDFDRVYLASKIIDSLRTVTGCLENGITEDEIRFRVTDYGDKRLKSLFIGGSSNDALGVAIQNTKSNLQTTIGGFVTKASKLETQISLRSTALVASQERLGLIAKAFEQTLGKIQLSYNNRSEIQGLGFNLDSSRGLAEARIKAASWQDKVASIERQLLAAFDGVNVNDYEKARQNFVIRGRYVKDEATGNINLNTKLTQYAALPALQAEVLAPMDQTGPAAVISRIEKNLRESPLGSAECAFFSPWYCETNAATMMAIPSNGAFP